MREKRKRIKKSKERKLERRDETETVKSSERMKGKWVKEGEGERKREKNEYWTGIRSNERKLNVANTNLNV